jgi:hypothetical protein
MAFPTLLSRALSRMRPDKDPRYERISIAGKFDLKVVNDKIPMPDLRIEYEDECLGIPDDADRCSEACRSPIPR